MFLAALISLSISTWHWGHLNVLFDPSFWWRNPQFPQVFEVKCSSQITTLHQGYSLVEPVWQNRGAVGRATLLSNCLTRLVQETLLETIMRPSQHGSGSLASYSPVSSLHHPLGFKLRKKHSVVLFDDPLGKLLVYFVHKISDLLPDPPCCPLHRVTFPVSYFLLGPLALQFIQDVAQSVNSSDIVFSPFDSTVVPEGE